MKKRRACALLFILCALLSGCAGRSKKQLCTVVFEDNEALFLQKQVYSVERFSSLSVSVGVPKGQRISDVNYDGFDLSPKTGESKSYDYYTLTLPQLRYGALIRMELAPAYETVYHYGAQQEYVTEDSNHLFWNVPGYRPEFLEEGCVPLGWQTEAGDFIPFGSRIDRRDTGRLELSLYSRPAADDAAFTWKEQDGGAWITGFSGGESLIIPPALGGLPVTGIASGAFGDLIVRCCILPPTLETVEVGAFGMLRAEEFYFFDNLPVLEETAFSGYSIGRLFLLAATPPVYSGTYFDTLPDKLNYLESLADTGKILLFAGSSARFGYDSPALEAAFPDYRVVNLGVFAYSNMRPLAAMALPFLREGDIVLSSPELDAVDTQFCGSTALDRETYCMAESDYALLSLLDCREFTNLFGAYSDFSRSRAGMTPKGYEISAADYDEDGVPTLGKTYNRQGDYIAYRENNYTRKPFGIKRAYYNSAHITDSDLEGLNDVYDRFTQQGAQVFFTYSPRSAVSLSEDSTPESIAALDAFLEEHLHAPVISRAEDSLLDPLYFYGTDNHLSTEGVTLYTNQVIEALHNALTHREAAP